MRKFYRQDDLNNKGSKLLFQHNNDIPYQSQQNHSFKNRVEHEIKTTDEIAIIFVHIDIFFKYRKYAMSNFPSVRE